MQSHKSIQEAIAGETVEHAKALHLSTALVNKWQEPSTDFTDSGALNPLDRLKTIIHTALRLGKSKDPYAPLHDLAADCNHVAFPIPRPNGDLGALTSELLDAVREFGKLSEEASKSMVSGDISQREFERIEKRGNSLCREVMEFVAAAKEAAK